MKLIYTLIAASLISSNLIAQKWGAVTTSDFVNEATDIETDALGNSYVTGYITGETAFSTSNYFPSAAGNGDIYVAKYASSGDLIWVKKFGGNYSDRGYDLCLDNSGNIFITGQFYGTVIFDGVSISSASNSKDIFLAKLSNNGNTIWAIAEGGAGAENAYGIISDQLGNVILTGQFQGASVIAGQNFTSQLDPLTNLASYDLFISKYDASGTPLWVNTGTTKYEDRGLAVSCDVNNNIYLSGQFSDTLVFSTITLNNNSYNVGFVTKLSPSGTISWFNTLRAGFLLPYDLEVNDNDLVITGDAKGTINYANNGSTTYSPSIYDNTVFILKTNLNGTQTWLKTIGSNNEISSRSISVDGSKNIFVTGYFSCAIDELHPPQSALYNSVGFKDAYLWKENQNGTLNYLKTFGSKLDDLGQGVAVLGTDNPVICGGNTKDLNIPMDNSSLYFLQSNNAFDLNYISYEPNHCYLAGDSSRNSFVTNAIFSATPELNYFVGAPIITDSLFMEIAPFGDTVHFCVDGHLYSNPKTWDHYGPSYDYLWSTGSIDHSIYVNTSGEYSVNIERHDECSSGFDSTVVIIHQLPPLPLMTDNLGLAINETGENYYTYAFCHPDSVQIWFNDLCPNCTITIAENSTIYTDTLPHTYFSSSTILVEDDYCASQGYFYIDFDYPNTYDYDPYLALVDIIDYNDSITICLNDFVEVQNLDYTNNPLGIFGLFTDDTITYQNWSVTHNGNQIPYEEHLFFTRFQPQTTGNYVVQYDVIVGYDNLCGIDTTHYTVIDTFFIEVLPNPILPNPIITGDNLLCPNGSLYLTTSEVVSSYNWSGPSIQWIDPNQDSVLIAQAGTYYYGGSYINPVTGCSTDYTASITILQKLPPIISSVPNDAIICPYDSVLMSVPNIYVAYDWTGPDGSSLSTTFNHWDDEQGFYYVTVLDDEGCYLTSPPYELKEYSTPYLMLDPSNVVCPGENTTITAITFGDGTYNWLQPLNHTSNVLTVTQPGWYICEMTGCGITITDSVEIIDGSFSIQLNYSDSVLCFGEDLVISATPGHSDYQWSNGTAGASSILIEDAGNYFVSAYNSYGCEAISDTLQVIEISNSVPPIINDVSICTPGFVALTNPTVTNWYSSDSTLLSTGTSININALGDTTILVSYAPIECPIAFNEVSIDLIENLPTFTISGDTNLCYNEDLILTVNATNESIQWMYGGAIVSTDTILIIPGNQIGTSTTVELTISNPCYSVDLLQNFSVHPIDSVEIDADSMIVCSSDDLTLTAEGETNNLTWSGNFGSVQEEILELNGPLTSGWISVNGVSPNGCSTNSDSVYIEVPSVIITFSGTFGNNCNGDSILIIAQTSLDSTIWFTPFGNVASDTISFELSNLTAGTYAFEGWDSYGCNYAQSTEITANLLPNPSAITDTILCLNDYFGSDYSTNEFTYSWVNPIFEDSTLVVGNQWYEFTVTGTNGCSITDSIYVVSVNCGDELPNVFTPNGDGVNDFFYIDEAIIFPNNRLIITNRWGNVIHSEDTYRNNFGGDGIADGVYFYIFYHDYQGHPEQYLKGFFHIVR